MADREDIAAKIVDAGGRLRVKSALNPMLWLCATVSGPIFLASSFKDNVPWWMILAGSTPIAVTCFSYVYLLFNDRDKLQSEDYQIRKQSLEIIGQKGGVSIAERRHIELMMDPISSDPQLKEGQ